MMNKRKYFFAGVVLLFGLFCRIAPGTFFVRAQSASPIASNKQLVTQHLTRITKTEGYRNYQNLRVLNQTAEYIMSVFAQYADTCWYQPYQADGRTYKNVVCRFGRVGKPLIVVGAHYDVCGNQEGADDNASGVVGLLELARMLKGQSLDYPIELVAYTLEEPPYFRTPYMDSSVHAQALSAANTPVYGMLALEMIGFFSNQKGSQSYPIKPMKVAYGTIGDFILVVKRSGAGDFVQRFSKAFNQEAQLEVSNIKAPAKLPGIDFSDHLNYWEHGYDALMITNTAFYRNDNYHQPSDTMETLDITRMTAVIDAVFVALIKVANEPPQKVSKKMSKNK